jgi:hypothetical protein
MFHNYNNNLLEIMIYHTIESLYISTKNATSLPLSEAPGHRKTFALRLEESIC